MLVGQYVQLKETFEIKDTDNCRLVLKKDDVGAVIREYQGGFKIKFKEGFFYFHKDMLDILQVVEPVMTWKVVE